MMYPIVKDYLGLMAKYRTYLAANKVSLAIRNRKKAEALLSVMTSKALKQIGVNR